MCTTAVITGISMFLIGMTTGILIMKFKIKSLESKLKDKNTTIHILTCDHD